MTHQLDLNLYTRIDMSGEQCNKCDEGRYKETSIHDDWDGVLHCDKCNHQVNRYTEILN